MENREIKTETIQDKDLKKELKIDDLEQVNGGRGENDQNQIDRRRISGNYILRQP